MKTLLITFQFISAFLLIGAVLLHTAKGEGLGGIGGQARLFGSQKGLETGLDRITTTLAAIFIALSLLLSIITG